MQTAINKQKIILAIDSSCGACSVAIWKNNEITAYYDEKETSSQAKLLILMIEKALSTSKINYNELSAVACTVGPGSFTGIRIGLATARAIGFSANIPVLGFSSLEVLAYGTMQETSSVPIIASLNAGKGEFIYQHFDKQLIAICPPTLSPNINEAVKFGFPRADLLAKLAANYPNHAVEPVPFYVRPPDAKLPSKANVT